MRTQFTVTKLTMQKVQLRMALFGPTGSGKTYTALTMACALTPGNVLIIDSERGSASRYAIQFGGKDGRVDHLDLPDHNPDTYVAALEYAAENGYVAVVIDSLSHAWMGKGGALEQVDNRGKANRAQGGFNAWREVTPMHNRLVDALLAFPGHLIATMRVKTEYVVEKDEKTGRSSPRKVGLSPVQRDGVEYEFDICAEMDQDNNLIVTKTRMADLGGAVIHKPDQKFAARILEWLNSGTDAAAPVVTGKAPQKPDVDAEAELARKQRNGDAKALIERWHMSPESVAGWKEACKKRNLDPLDTLLTASKADGVRDFDDADAWLLAQFPLASEDGKAEFDAPAEVEAAK
jgi:energy-coupling factor transporter ATP-binding protein EcfA2